MTGQFSIYILKTIELLGSKNVYGISIHEKLENVLNKKVSVAAIYTTLNRLDEKGFVFTEKGEITKTIGGKAKTYYYIAPRGEKVLLEFDRVCNIFSQEKTK